MWHCNMATGTYIVAQALLSSVIVNCAADEREESWEPASQAM